MNTFKIQTMGEREQTKVLWFKLKILPLLISKCSQPTNLIHIRSKSTQMSHNHIVLILRIRSQVQN